MSMYLYFRGELSAAWASPAAATDARNARREKRLMRVPPISGMQCAASGYDMQRLPVSCLESAMSVQSDVLCAGIVVADHVCNPIPRVPAAGELVLTDRFLLTIGGCAANVAVDLTRMGV